MGLTIINQVWNWLASQWKYILGIGGPLMALAHYAGEIIDYVLDGMEMVTGTLNSAATSYPVAMTTFSAYLAQMNAIFPLSETFTLFRAWLALYVICWVIRTLKTFIPGLS